MYSPFHRPELASDTIITLGNFHVTNSVLAGFAVSAIILIIVFFSKRKFDIIPSKIQIIFEMLVSFFLNTLIDAYGSEEKARKFLPLIVTFFIYIALANIFFMIPFINSMVANVAEHGVPLFRVPTSDWSQGLALAIVAILGAHIIGFSIHPIGHINAFIRFKDFLKIRSFSDLFNAFINFFIGIIELIGEIAKPISLSARLFGNIFAGEMMIAVIATIAQPFTWYFMPTPFILLGVFVGFIQAFVFTFLSTLFMAQTIKAASH